MERDRPEIEIDFENISIPQLVHDLGEAIDNGLIHPEEAQRVLDVAELVVLYEVEYGPISMN